MCAAKQSHGVEEYSFSQSTLEQVFLNFAKRQLVEGEDAGAGGDTALPQRQLSLETQAQPAPAGATVNGGAGDNSQRLVTEL